MSDPIRQSWQTADKMLSFEFTIRPDSPNGPMAIVADVNWIRTPQANFTIVLQELYGSTSFQHTYPDGMILRGELKGISIVSPGDWAQAAVFGDFHYGSHDFRHFEGTMITYPTEPTNPVDPIIPVSPYSGSTTVTGSVQTCDLFPYVFLRTWPHLDPERLERDFVFYRTSSPPTAADSFFLALSQLTTQSNARVQIEKASQAYLDGQPPWTGMDIRDINNLNGAISCFHQLDRRLIDDQPEDREQALAIVELDLELTAEQLETYLQSAIYAVELGRVWQTLFAHMVLLGYRVCESEQLIRTIRMSHFLPRLLSQLTLNREEIIEYANASVVLPQPVFPLPANGSISGLSPGWVKPYAVGDLQMVRQRLLGYRGGEIARIVNVMPGERKEISRRSRKATIETQNTTEKHSKKSRHFNSQKESNLSDEVTKTIVGKTKSINYSDFKTNYGPPTTATLSGGWDEAWTTNSPGQKQATRFAREVLDESRSSLARQVSEVRQLQVTDETEESENSVVDNVQGDCAIVGVYRWLNKVLEATVVRYGARFLVEMEICQPGRFLAAPLALSGTRNLEPPVTLASLGVTRFTDITAQNYADLAASLGVTQIEPPPEATKTVSAVFNGHSEQVIELPDGYQANLAVINCVMGEGTAISRVQGALGQKQFVCQPGKSVSLVMDAETSQVPAAVSATAVAMSPPEVIDSFQVIMVVTTQPTTNRMTRWQIDTYQQLSNAAQEAQRSFYAITDANQRSPSAEVDMERRAIKRAGFAVLMQHAESKTGSQPYGSPDDSAELAPAMSQFIDRVFEWNELSFQLLEPQLEEPEPLIWSSEGVSLAEFQQARLARVLLPIRPDYVLRAALFLESGSIWPGADPLTPVLDQDLALISHLKALDRQASCEQLVEPGWEVLLPTSLQILENTILEV